MTPLEFNRTGEQAQLEIFEAYFDSLNQQIRIPQTNTDFADRVVGIDEKMSIFKEFEAAVPILVNGVATSTFNLPQQFSGTLPASQEFANAPVTNPAILTGSALALSNAGAVSHVYLNNVEIASSAYSLNGANLTLNTTPLVNQVVRINLYPKQFYRLGSLFYTLGALPTQELERVDRSELYHLLSSKLTAPSQTYPIYVYENNEITVSPATINQGITTSYIRKPLPPVWSFTQAATGQYSFQVQSSFNFELHPSDQTELILKILLYAGVVVKDPTIIQVASQQIQQEQNNQKS